MHYKFMLPDVLGGDVDHSSYSFVWEYWIHKQLLNTNLFHWLINIGGLDITGDDMDLLPDT